MKDAYSFDLDQAGLDRSFEDQRRRPTVGSSRGAALEYVIVEADSGAMGGSASNEFMVYTDAGEDLVVSCPRCHYAANLEKAASRIAPVDDGADGSAAREVSDARGADDRGSGKVSRWGDCRPADQDAGLRRGDGEEAS
jgi:prolyl-tRNA synthetase